MIKRNKGTLMITTIIMLLPMVIGLIAWNKLPERVPMHWNAAGEVDGWESKGMLVFFLPLFMVGLQWVCALAASFAPEGKGFKGKILHLVLWICPFTSILIHALVYVKILGYDLAVNVIIPLTFGLIFMVIGNLLPKCKRNHIIGIKVSWALNDDENWNKTHRFAGKLWVIGGAVMAATAVFGKFFLFFGIALLMVIVPTVYSYMYFHRSKKNEQVD